MYVKQMNPTMKETGSQSNEWEVVVWWAPILSYIGEWRENPETRGLIGTGDDEFCIKLLTLLF